MSIKLKDTIFDYIDKAYKDGSGNTISSTYLPLSGGTLTGFLRFNTSSTSTYIQHKVNDVIKAELGYHPNYGVFIKNENSGKFLYVTDSGVAKFDGNTIIHSGNISSQSVNYASSAGSVAWGNVTGKPSTFTPSDHSHSQYLTSSSLNNYVTLDSAQTITGEKTVHTTASGDKLSFGNKPYTLTITRSGGWAAPIISVENTRTDNTTNLTIGAYGAQGTIERIYTAFPGEGHDNPSFQVRKNSAYINDGTANRSIIHSGNIGNQSVNYASSAGSVTWGNVSGKPSTFTPSSHTHTKSQITDFPSSLPASDVYGWAKASTKPSYTYSEVGAPMHKYLFYKADYEHYVVLLCKIGTGITGTNHRISGKIYTETGGSSRYQAADIDVWRSDWSSGNDSYTKFNTYGLGEMWDLVTCKYGNSTYLAIRNRNTQACYAYFQGTATNIDFTAIKYYTSNTSTVNNSEINGSISVVSSFDRYAWKAEIPTKVSQLTNDSGYLTSLPSHTHSYLPLSGGTLSNGGSSDTSLYVRGNTTSSWIGFQSASGTTFGWFGITSDKIPYFHDGTARVLLHSSNYSSYAATKDHTHSYLPFEQTVNNKNLDTIKTTGFYYGYNMSNSATTEISSFIVAKYSLDWGTQIQLCSGASRSYIRYWRNSGGIMGDWYTLAYTSDIPTKVSQLTNDSGYLTSLPSHTHSYLPLSGGTMTGNITVHTGADSCGLKFGTSTLNSLSNQLIWQSPEAIRFGSTSWDWNSWAGLKYNHSNKTIYLGLADNTIFNANSAQSGGKLYTPGVSSIHIGNGTYTVLHTGNWSSYCAATSHTHSDYMVKNDPIANGTLRMDGSNSRGSFPAVKLHISGVTWSQMLMNGSGELEFRAGGSQDASYVTTRMGACCCTTLYINGEQITFVT